MGRNIYTEEDTNPIANEPEPKTYVENYKIPERENSTMNKQEAIQLLEQNITVSKMNLESYKQKYRHTVTFLKQYLADIDFEHTPVLPKELSTRALLLDELLASWAYQDRLISYLNKLLEYVESVPDEVNENENK